MIYVFHGTDLDTSRKKAQSLINSLRTKRPDAAYEEITSDNWSTSVLESHLGGQGLFSSKYIIFLNRVTDNVEADEQIADFISPMNESENVFILLEGKLGADLKKKIAKGAEKAVESEPVSKAFKKQEFNIFALGEALGMRDPVKSWIIYRQAVDNGVEAESIVGTLFWQVKSIILAGTTNNASEAGLNPFVYSKSKAFVRNYTLDELRKMAAELITLYHDGHRGLVDIELGVERLLLRSKVM